MYLSEVPLLFETSRKGRRNYQTPGADHAVATANLPKEFVRDTPPALPEIGELDLVRHFTRLSQKNYAISTNFYPLGSCTMKYNPVVHEKIDQDLALYGESLRKQLDIPVSDLDEYQSKFFKFVMPHPMNRGVQDREYK